ncbi:MAG: MFS transporter [Candidatus Hodarchaeota archaeon]
MALENKREIYRSYLKEYLFFWTGQLVSILGSNVVQFGIIYWLTIESSKQYPELATIILGLSAFLGFGSFILMTPIAGVFVDRWSRKKIIVISDSLQAGVTFILIYLFAIGLTNIWLILGVLTLRGFIGAFQGPATQAIIPLMVPEKHLTRMNSVSYLANSMILIVGPAIGAVLYFVFAGNLATILWIDVVTFLVAIVPAILVYIPPVKTKKELKKASFREEFTEGIVFIRQKKGLLTLLSMFTIANFLLTPLNVLLPLFTLQTVALGNEETAIAFLAVLTGLQNLSMLLGSSLMSVWGGFKRNVIGVAFGLFFGGMGAIIIAFTPPGVFWIPAIGLLLNGLTIPIANIHSQTIWQKVVPPEKLGRVFSVRVTIAQFTAPAAMLLGGIVAAVVGIPVLFFICGITQILAIIIAWFMTTLPHVEDMLLKTEPDSEISEEVIAETKEITPNIIPIDKIPHSDVGGAED